MGTIKELYDFVSAKGLELHTHVHNGRHRVVILWPNGTRHNGDTMNMDLSEAESEDPEKAAAEAFAEAVMRYTEIVNRMEQTKKDAKISNA